MSSLGLAETTAKQTAIFFASFMTGSALWALLLSFAIARLRVIARHAFFRAVSVLSGIALGAFSAIAAGRVVTTLLGI